MTDKPRFGGAFFSPVSHFALAANLLSLLLLVVLALAAQRALARSGVWSWKDALAGAVTFIVAARVLEPLFLMYSGLLATATAPGASAVAAVLVFAACAAVFEESGRLGMLALRRRSGSTGARTLLSFAVGYAIAELLLIGIVGHGQLLVLARMPEEAARVLGSIAPELRAGVERALVELDATSAIWLLLERLAALVLQVAMTLLVWRALEERRAAWFFTALGLHFAIDVLAAAYQFGLLPLWAVEIVIASAGALAARMMAPQLKALAEGRPGSG